MGEAGELDLYRVEELLEPEERELRLKVRGFVEEECMGIIAQHFDRGSFPMHLIPRMAQLGLFGVQVQGYGCKPISNTMYGLICQELGRCDSGLRAMFSVQNSLVMDPIFRYGSPSQKDRWLPLLARGEVIGCFALSEPEAGSNPSAITTRAEPRGDTYVLNGTKMWITNGTIAHLAVVWVKLGEDIRGFLVETSTPGLKASPIRRKFSYRTSPTALITLDDCVVPEEAMLPHARGLKPVLQCLNLARYGVACGALGSALACYQAAHSFASRRHVFDRPVASYQLVQEKLVRMALEITKAQLLSLRLGRLMDTAGVTPAQISLLKLNNVREAMKIARSARDILGARGILADHHVIRHLCDLEALATLEGTHSIHTLILGQALTGISAFHR
ncbi:MAG: acyl-CoA dehydrogenase family protein [Thermodesulfobacteriota bacterium]